MATKKFMYKKIQHLRKEVGMSQQEIADKIGINRTALSQIESGDRKISAEELQKIAELFDVDINIFFSNIDIKIKDKDIKSKDKHYNLKQLILYVVESMAQSPTFGKTVLNKLLYFCDFNYYEWTGELITGETYKKLPYGPVPDKMEKVLYEMEENGLLQTITKNYYGHSQYKLIALVEPDISFLDDIYIKNKQEQENYKPEDDLKHPKEFIDDIIKKFMYRKANEISQWSHNDIPYKATKNIGDEILPDLVFYRYQNPAYVSNYHNLDDDD